MADPANSFFQSDQVDQQPMRHTLLFRLVGYLKPYWGSLIILLVLMAAGAALRVEAIADVTLLMLVVMLQFLTAPVGAHLVGRSAYASGGQLAPDTVVDELADAD